MVGLEAALEIRVLHRHGKSIREIAGEMGVSRNTVRRYLRDEEAARYKSRPPRPIKLDPSRRLRRSRRRDASLEGTKSRPSSAHPLHRVVKRVKAPGSLSIVIVPPCCCVTMS